MYKSDSSTKVLLTANNSQIDQHSHGNYIGFFCPNCFCPIIKRYSVQEEYFYDPEFVITKNYSLTCPECGNQFEQNWFLDANITPIIALLNKKGYITEFCCEGHYSKDDDGDEYVSDTPYILFSFSKDIIFDNLDLPYPWYEDSRGFDNILSYEYGRLCIRCNLEAYDTSKQSAMDVIREWVERLPTEIYSYDKQKNISITEAVKPYIDFRKSIEQFLYDNIIAYTTNIVDYTPEKFAKINMKTV